MYKWIMFTLFGLAGLLIIFLVATGLPEKQEVAEQEPQFTVPEMAVDAEAAGQIFQSRCISCHGTDLQGGAGPALATVGSTLSKERIYTVIKEGRGGMPSFEKLLSEDEILTLTTWLSSLK